MFNPTPKPKHRKKKAPKPLKRTPLPRPTKPIAKVSAKRKATIDAGLVKLTVGKPLKRFTPERQRLENEKHKMYASEAETRQPFCRGCGTTQNLSHSHRISQNDRTQIANPENVDYYCQDVCHRSWENGRCYLLDNGNEALEFLAGANWEKYAAKVFKMLDRINDDNLSLSDLPSWVEAHVLAVTK